MKSKYISLFALVIGFLSCEDVDSPIPEQEILPELTTGSADFSKYVAIGASFTAGFTDGGLFAAGQENSFPNMLSQQFAKVGGGAFTQPIMDDNTGGILVEMTPFTGYRLVFNSAIPGPQPLNSFLTEQGLAVPPITTEAGNSIGSNFNNFGIPGAKSFHLVSPVYAGFNPFYARIASAPTATVLADAIAQSPTFFTLSEVGGNDVLSYATSGGAGVDQTGNIDPSTYGPDDITDVNVFANAFNQLVTGLTANGAKGVVTNVPNIIDLPHFTTVPHNPIPLDAATAGFLNSAAVYGAYNVGIQQAFSFLVANNLIDEEKANEEIAKRTITFEASANNAVVIMDENLTDLTMINPALVSMRQATAEDLLVLPASNFIGSEAIPGNPQTINGVAIPLADKWVLTPEEQQAIATATTAYNTIISSLTDANENVALVDLNTILSEISSTGVDFEGFNLTSDLVFGGAFSLDGIHPTAKGYAFMANKFLEKIDDNFGSNFIDSGSTAKANNFPTNYSPSLPNTP